MVNRPETDDEVADSLPTGGKVAVPSRVRQVWKFPLSLGDARGYPVQMPHGAKVVHVAWQKPSVCIWVEVDPGAEKVIRLFHIVGTGWDIPREGQHLGTAHDDSGCVWHVYGHRVQP